MLKILFLNSIAVSLAFASTELPHANRPRRISSQIVDLAKVHPIYMVPGMATLIELPTPITGIRTGNPEDVQYYKPESPDNEVTVLLKNAAAQPTNLILRSGKRKYVFDIVPSKSLHQDTVEVVGSYGGPDLKDAQLIDSSSSSKNEAKKGAEK
jgi:hypothetical protein